MFADSQDQEGISSTWGPLDVQFQGNRSERFRCFCALKGKTFLFQNEAIKVIGPFLFMALLKTRARDLLALSRPSISKVLTSEKLLKVSFALSCTKHWLSWPEPYPGENDNSGYERAIELIHPERMSLFKKDYVYVIATDDKTFQRWYCAIHTPLSGLLFACCLLVGIMPFWLSVHPGELSTRTNLYVCSYSVTEFSR